MPDGNRWNTLGHWGMGIAAALVPGLHVRWAEREREQNPQENDEYPMVFVAFQGPLVIDVSCSRENLIKRLDWRDDTTMHSELPRFRVVAYYAAPRVWDSQKDMLEIARGAEVGRVLAIALWLGVGVLFARALV